MKKSENQMTNKGFPWKLSENNGFLKNSKGFFKKFSAQIKYYLRIYEKNKDS